MTHRREFRARLAQDMQFARFYYQAKAPALTYMDRETPLLRFA